MISNPRLETLERRRAATRGEISQELAHPRRDDLAVSRLKRRNLALKDEIADLSAR